MLISLTRQSLVLCMVVVICAASIPAMGAEAASGGTMVTPDSEIKQLGDEVDILQFIAGVGLSRAQVTQLAGKVAQINARRKEYAKKEQEILQKVKAPLEQMKAALIEGKPVPDSAKLVADSGMKELEALRKQGWQEYDNFVASASTVLTDGQIRDIRRNPKAMKRAGEIAQDIRFCSENKYPAIRDKYVEELVAVKKIDEQEEWLKLGQEKLSGLTGEARAEALKELEQVKETDTAAMKSESSRLLDLTRSANSVVLSSQINKLASALRPDREVYQEIDSMMARILDSPAAEAILKSRAEKMKDEPVE